MRAYGFENRKNMVKEYPAEKLKTDAIDKSYKETCELFFEILPLNKQVKMTPNRYVLAT